ncbi:hypothetical protein O181_001881 [Austropuccinia psidii MF-1]|uniref:Uncharacterized protein n=1 Tax=Austropuccinia psidii MF-1 TaxID=1389203 RepID=A0A9Q3BB15_9BASI|nr:hypothetical protein [Austropuccinia psidii MF-1]
MVRTKPDSAHHQNYLKDDEPLLTPIDFMACNKPNREYHEVNDTETNHKSKLQQSQRQHIHDSKQIMSQLRHSNREYRNISTISIYKKEANATFLILPSLKTLPHPHVIIDKTRKPFLPVIIYEITPFGNSPGASQILKYFIITLMTLSQNWQ